jgi:hypothetical protein
VQQNAFEFVEYVICHAHCCCLFSYVKCAGNIMSQILLKFRFYQSFHKVEERIEEELDVRRDFQDECPIFIFRYRHTIGLYWSHYR